MGEWLGVFGRLHPLLLHFPIGFLGALALVEAAALLRRSPLPRSVVSTLAWFAAASAALVAAMGYTLSREEGYGDAPVVTHRWLGIAVAVCSVSAALFHARSRSAPRGARLGYRSFLLLALALLVPAGHFGSTITHGEGFLTEPLRARAEAPSVASAPSPSSYERAIAPIFAARCTGCHGTGKRKSGLSLHEPAAILRGGKRGAVLVPGKPEESPMVRRLRLPPELKDHMPPREKPQPTPAEIRRIEDWIAAGAPFEGEVPGLSEIAIEAPASGPAESAAASVPPADPGALEAVRRALVHVEAVERGSNLLSVDFSAVAPRTSDAEATALLEPLREQVSDLSLGRSAITDATLALLARMPNLRRADLRGTPITDAGIAALARHERLEALVLAQTRLTDAAVDSLLGLPSLTRVYLWKSGVSDEGAARLRRERPSLEVDGGDAPDARVVEAEGEVRLTSDAPLLGPPAGSGVTLEPVNKACPVSGKPVDPAFRVVYRGRVVGFCCAKCPSEFWADPSKYESKLP